MINGAKLASVAALGLSIVAGTVAWMTAPQVPPPPPCLQEDGGPIPCVWNPMIQGTYHPGDPTDPVTITLAP